MVTFAPGAAYDSDNYRWFTERHRRGFYYLDRIVLHERFRRRGLGGFVYDEVERVAAPYGRLALEVNLVPRNDAVAGLPRAPRVRRGRPARRRRRTWSR